MKQVKKSFFFYTLVFLLLGMVQIRWFFFCGPVLSKGVDMPVGKHLEIKKYRLKRDFEKSPEPYGQNVKEGDQPIFVVQKHNATQLHYDFRLEVDGVLVSWVVPKGIPRRAGVKRLAVMTEDHPLDYATFEGVIPEGEYGAGTVEMFDSGHYDVAKKESGKPLSMRQALARGKVEVVLHGTIFSGLYALIRTRMGGEKENWLLIKMKKVKLPVRRGRST